MWYKCVGTEETALAPREDHAFSSAVDRELVLCLCGSVDQFGVQILFNLLRSYKPKDRLQGKTLRPSERRS